MSMAGDVRCTALYFCINNDIPQDKAIALLNELVEDMGGDPENWNFGEWVASEYSRLQKAAQQSVQPTVLTALHKLVSCPQCLLVFDANSPASHIG